MYMENLVLNGITLYDYYRPNMKSSLKHNQPKTNKQKNKQQSTNKQKQTNKQTTTTKKEKRNNVHINMSCFPKIYCKWQVFYQISLFPSLIEEHVYFDFII